MAVDPWTYWQAAKKWRADPKRHKAPEFDKHHPEQGYYRGQRNEAVAIWWNGDAVPAARRSPGLPGAAAD